MIVLGPVKDDGAAFKRIGIIGVGEIAIAEFLRNHTGFHDRIVEQIAFEDEEACGLPQRFVHGIDHSFVENFGFSAVFAHCFAVNGQNFLVNEPSGLPSQNHP